MALTITTGMTTISNADALGTWAAVRFAGSGGAPAASLETTIYYEGTGSVAAKLAGNNWNSALVFTMGANVNMTTAGNEVVSVMVQITTPGIILNLNAGGGYILVSSTVSGTPAVYSEYWVTGADVYPGGFVNFMIDTRKTASATVGGGATLTAVRQVGFGVRCVAAIGTVKSDNTFVDLCTYGRPNYTIVGDGSTNADWQAIIDHSNTNKNKLVEDVGGAYVSSTGFTIGSGSQGATTTFSDSTGKQLLFKRFTYYQGAVVDALNYIDYYKFTANGAASFKTSVTLGTVVGTGDNRQGVLGGALRSGDTTNVNWSADFATNIANLTIVKFYGFNFVGAKGGITLNDGTKSSVISSQIVNCGVVDLGTISAGAEVLNAFIIDPLGTTNNYGINFPQTPSSGTLTHNVKKTSFVTSGSPTTQYMVTLPFSGAYTIGNDAIVYYGDYSSGTLWHGLNSGTSAAVTIAATNGSNAVNTEFSNTAGGSVTVQNSVNLSITVVDENNSPVVGNGTSTGARVAVYNASTLAVIISPTYTNASGIVTGTFNYSTDTNIIVRVRLSSTGATRYQFISTTGTITNTGYSNTITLNVDSIVAA